MSYRAQQKDLVKALREIPERAKAKGKDAQFALDVMIATLVNYEPKMLDLGAELDRLCDENERLKAIVSLIDMKNENDALKAKLAAQEAAYHAEKANV